jgi:uncharacterized protein YjiS (DUF1127 family)
MNTRTRTFDFHVTRMGFTGILQGHYVSEKVYAMVQSVESGFTKVNSLVKGWVRNSAGRKELARLDARMLRDIGLEPFEVQREINKPFWKA